MSKYLKQAEKVSIPRHRHCVVCATPIALEREFCSQNCEDEFRRAERKRKYMMIVPLLLIFPFFLLILFMGRR